MCLAIPGKIIEIDQCESPFLTARVSFGGIIKTVNLSLVPEAGIGDYVIVHAGVAINRLNQGAAREILNVLQNLDGQVEES